jgi:hypothetical protein
MFGVVINPRRTCTVRVTVLGLCVTLSVCLSSAFFILHATRLLISATDGFRTTQAWKLKWRFSWKDCVRVICRENKWKWPCNLNLICVLCVPWRQNKSGVYRQTHASVASLCQVDGKNWRFNSKNFSNTARYSDCACSRVQRLFMCAR